MPGPAGWHNNQIVKSVKEGILDEKILNRCAERVVDVIFRTTEGQGSFDLEAHHNIARKVGEGSAVLLKNDRHVLPLKKEQTVAFIGPYAKNLRYQGGGSSHINSFKVTNTLAETFPLRLEDNPSYLDFGGHNDCVNYREGIFVGYRYYDHKKMKVLFPFGHGLSYTAFSYENL